MLHLFLKGILQEPVSLLVYCDLFLLLEVFSYNETFFQNFTDQLFHKFKKFNCLSVIEILKYV